jgi:hypothetical protein
LASVYASTCRRDSIGLDQVGERFTLDREHLGRGEQLGNAHGASATQRRRPRSGAPQR